MLVRVCGVVCVQCAKRRVEFDEDMVPGGRIAYWKHTHPVDGVIAGDLRRPASVWSGVRVLTVLPHPRIFDAHAFGFELSRYGSGVDLTRHG